MCFNEHGDKAVRKVNKSEATIVSEEWVPGYNVANPRMPSGICKPCIFDINKFKDGIEVHPLLSDKYL